MGARKQQANRDRTAKNLDGLQVSQAHEFHILRGEVYAMP